MVMIIGSTVQDLHGLRKEYSRRLSTIYAKLHYRRSLEVNDGLADSISLILSSAY